MIFLNVRGHRRLPKKKKKLPTVAPPMTAINSSFILSSQAIVTASPLFAGVSHPLWVKLSPASRNRPAPVLPAVQRNPQIMKISPYVATPLAADAVQLPSANNSPDPLNLPVGEPDMHPPSPDALLPHPKASMRCPPRLRHQLMTATTSP
ncbi:hypothetical protein C8J57DRAFT_1460373, partial [Mycena rebaudengoi]